MEFSWVYFKVTIFFHFEDFLKFAFNIYFCFNSAYSVHTKGAKDTKQEISLAKEKIKQVWHFHEQPKTRRT